MATVLKVTFGDDVRRLTLNDGLTFDSVTKMIWDEWPDISSGKIKYMDDEGDLCTMARATFEDFRILSEMTKVVGTTGRHIIKLYVHLPDSTAQKGRRAPIVTPPKAADGTDGSALPPGLDEDAPASNSSCRYGGCGSGGGPWKVLKVMRALHESRVLTPSMLASVTGQWLPMITQRATRKLDKINWMTWEHGITGSLRLSIEVLVEVVTAIPSLACFTAPLQDLLEGRTATETASLGDTICALLKALQLEPFEVQMSIMQQLAEKLMPVIEDATNHFAFGRHEAEASAAPKPHEGITCDACGSTPIVGPRFKCSSCPQYDLCGNCYPKMDTIHSDTTGAPYRHDFQCILPEVDGVGKCWKGGRKGWKGKAAAWMADGAGDVKEPAGQCALNGTESAEELRQRWGKGKGNGKEGGKGAGWDWWSHMAMAKGKMKGADWFGKGKGCTPWWENQSLQSTCNADAGSSPEASSDQKGVREAGV